MAVSFRTEATEVEVDAGRALADARADAALQRRKQADRSNCFHATGGGCDSGGF